MKYSPWNEAPISIVKMNVESKFCYWQSHPFSHLKPRIHNARSPLVQALEIDATSKHEHIGF